MVLDDKRFTITRAQDDGLKKLQDEKGLLMSELKGKKKELDIANGVVAGLNNHLKDSQTEVTSLRAKVEQLKKKRIDLKENKKEKLDEAE